MKHLELEAFTFALIVTRNASNHFLGLYKCIFLDICVFFLSPSPMILFIYSFTFLATTVFTELHLFEQSLMDVLLL